MRKSFPCLIGLFVAAAMVMPCSAKYGGGSGTAEEPYLITDANDLDEMRAHPEDWDDDFALTADIDLAGRSYTTAVIAPDTGPGNDREFHGTPFAGVLDGRGHSILNMTVDGAGVDKECLGLIGQVAAGAVVKDLSIETCKLVYQNCANVGGLAGCNDGGTIMRCTVNGTVAYFKPAQPLGGLRNAGLLVGYHKQGVVTECEVAGMISTGSVQERIGGLIGHNGVEGAVESCCSDVELSGAGWSNGGLVGDNCGTIQDSLATGIVRGDQYTGGLAAVNTGTIEDCRAEGDVYGGSLWNTGGLVAVNGGTIRRSHATGAVVSLGADNAGGLVGRNNGVIEECWACGTISAQGGRGVGGLAGHNSGTIARCRAQVDMTLSGGSSLGGLVGHLAGSVQNCYVIGKIAGIGQPSHVGGLVGWQSGGDILNCYAAVALDWADSFYADSLVGYANGGSRVGCFWNIDVALWGYSGRPLTTADMKRIYPFVAWGCSGAWVVDEGNDYPRLAWERTPGEPIPCVALEGRGTEEEPWLIRSQLEFDTFAANEDYWQGCTRLECDIDLAGRTYLSAVIAPTNASHGFTLPEHEFAGEFDGNGHFVRNLSLEAKRYGAKYLGLFGYVAAGGTVSDLAVLDSKISCQGVAWEGSVYAHYVGLIAGRSLGSILRCRSTGMFDLTGNCRSAGGLAGSNAAGPDGPGVVSMCTSTCRMNARAAAQNIGGLLGSNGGTVLNSFASGRVNVGPNSMFAGGLVGANYRGIVGTCYATTRVETGEGSTDVGGLIGDTQGDAVAENSFWDTDASGQLGSDGGEGKITLEMMAAETFLEAGWDFVGEVDHGVEDVWAICEGTNYPRLAWQIPRADIACPDGVALEDYAAVAGAWMSGPGDGHWNAACDLAESEPSLIDSRDLAAMAQQWLDGWTERP